jgi:hypothetical protein
MQILPDTPWEQIRPTRTFLDELLQNPLIKESCPRVERIVRDTRLKAQELTFDDDAEPLVALMEGDQSLLASIVAYTHDLQQPDGLKTGNLFYEMNTKLRDRTAAGRTALMGTWGVAVHYTLKAPHAIPRS